MKLRRTRKRSRNHLILLGCLTLLLTAATYLFMINQENTIPISPPEESYADTILPEPMPGTNTYNIIHFGAKGNGRADDTRVLQNAFDAVAKVRGTIYFPSGVYTVDPNKSLTVKSNLTLTGEGSDSILKPLKGKTGSSLLILAGSNIQVNNLRMDGNNAINTILSVQSESENIQIEQCTLANASQPGSSYDVVSGILIHGNTKDIRIDRNNIGHLTAINPDERGSLVARGIYVTTSIFHPEAIGKQITITNNHIHDIGPADDGDGIYYEDRNLGQVKGEDTGSTIANNLFVNCAKRAIKLYAQGIVVSHNRIVNNYLNNNYYRGSQKGKLAPDMYAGISIYADNNTITGNILEGIGSYYAAIEITAAKLVNQIEVSNNSITMGAQSNLEGTTAIRIGNVNHFLIASNSLMNAEIGIWTWQKATDGIIKENKITMPGGGGINISSYVSDSYQRDIRIMNNDIKALYYNVQTNQETNTNIIIE